MIENVIGLKMDQWAQDKAEEYFVRICGQVPKDQESFVSRMRVGSRLDIKASFKEYDYIAFHGETDGVKVGEELFQGGIFRYFNQKEPVKILPYLLTIGPLPRQGTKGLLEEFYVDAWGSAYVEAAHDLLKKRLKRIYGNSLYLSEPFGPGYYGIPVEGTRGLFRLLDASRLGMELNESGMMLPEKSCSGFFVLTRRPAPLPKDCCESCLSPHSCGYCRKYEGQETGENQQ